eukprot:Opistho-2@31585
MAGCLPLRECVSKGIFVENLSTHEIMRAFDATEFVKRAFANRSVAVTGINRESSRSHVVLTITVDTHKENMTKRSRLNFVDLAGSERQRDVQTPPLQSSSSARDLSSGLSSSSGGVKDRRSSLMRESENINKSLSALTGVITALSESESGRQHVPYRDSKLTFLLKDSLGGNSRTRIIATVSPLYCYRGDTMATLGFAARAKSIKCSVHVNEAVASNQFAHVTALENEIATLKAALARARGDLVRECNEVSIPSAVPFFVECGVQTDPEEGTPPDMSVGLAMEELREANAALQSELNAVRVSFDEKGAALQAALTSAENECRRLRSNESDCTAQWNADRNAMMEAVAALHTSQSRNATLEAQMSSLEGQCAQLRAQWQAEKDSGEQLTLLQASLHRAEEARREKAGQFAEVEVAFERAECARREAVASADVLRRDQDVLRAELTRMQSEKASLLETVNNLQQEIDTHGCELRENALDLSCALDGMRDERDQKSKEVERLLEDVEDGQRELRALKDSVRHLETDVADARESNADLHSQLDNARRSNELLKSQLVLLIDAIDKTRAADASIADENSNAPNVQTGTVIHHTGLKHTTAPMDTQVEDAEEAQGNFGQDNAIGSTVSSHEPLESTFQISSATNTQIDEDGARKEDVCVETTHDTDAQLVQQHGTSAVPVTASPQLESAHRFAEECARGETVGENSDVCLSAHEDGNGDRDCEEDEKLSNSDEESECEEMERGVDGRTQSLSTPVGARPDSRRRTVSFSNEVCAIERTDAAANSTKKRRRRRLSDQLLAFKRRIRNFLRPRTRDDASVTSEKVGVASDVAASHLTQQQPTLQSSTVGDVSKSVAPTDTSRVVPADGRPVDGALSHECDASAGGAGVGGGVGGSATQSPPDVCCPMGTMHTHLRKKRCPLSWMLLLRCQSRRVWSLNLCGRHLQPYPGGRASMEMAGREQWDATRGIAALGLLYRQSLSALWREQVRWSSGPLARRWVDPCKPLTDRFVNYLRMRPHTRHTRRRVCIGIVHIF